VPRIALRHAAALGRDVTSILTVIKTSICHQTHGRAEGESIGFVVSLI